MLTKRISDKIFIEYQIIKNVHMPKQCFLFQSHYMTACVEQEFQKLAYATQGLGDALILYHLNSNNDDSRLRQNPHFIVTDETIYAMNYRRIGAGLSEGSTHFPLLRYQLDHPEYEYYWLIENDVQYSGDWREFFDYFDGNDADYLTAHIYPHKAMPEWCWWRLKHPNLRVPLRKRIRSFNPVCRVSAAALKRIHRLLGDGWFGHNEVLMPTLLYLSGFRIEDFGGVGPFVPAGRKGRFYTSSPPNSKGLLSDGTYRFRPVWEQIGMEEGKLYHPIKLPKPDSPGKPHES